MEPIIKESKHTRHFAAPFEKPWHYFVKLVILSIFLLIDVTLNATSEYGNFNNINGTSKSATSNLAKDQIHKLHILLSSYQLLSQMSSFTIIFSLICDTFPFQIGLIGVLLKRFKLGLCIYAAYIITTLVLNGVRLSKLNEQSLWTIQDLWSSLPYTMLSFCQKLVAPFFYAESLRVSIELGSIEYYSKDAWAPSISRYNIETTYAKDHLQ